MKHADGFALFLLCAMAAAVLVSLWRARRGRPPFVRRIAGLAALEEAVERATEMGRPVVFALGHSSLQSIETHAALSVLAHVARLSARLRTRLIALVSQPAVYPVAEETVRQAYVAEGMPDQFQAADQVRFLSDNSIIYAMGAARLIEEARAGCAIFFGAFDFTSLLMAEPGARLGVLQIAGDPSLFQIPFFVCTCDHTLIGEEYYAAGAYVSSDPTARASLRSQDLIKVLLAAVILAGATVAQLPQRWAQKIVTQLKSYK